MGIVAKSDAKIARRCEPGIDESLFHVLIPPLTPRRRVNPSMTHFSLSRAALSRSVVVAFLRARIVSLRFSGVGAGEERGAPRRMGPSTPNTDPYAALELKPGASDEEVKAAFRRLAHVHHPDKASSGAGKAEARFAFNRITAARNRLLGDGNATRGWSNSHNTGMGSAAGHMGNVRRAGKISNTAFAAVLALPLCLIGVVSNWAFPSEQSRLVAGAGVGGNPDGHMGRVNGFLEPPVNPWLKDEVVEEGRRRGMHRKSVYDRIGSRMMAAVRPLEGSVKTEAKGG